MSEFTILSDIQYSISAQRRRQSQTFARGTVARLTCEALGVILTLFARFQSTIPTDRNDDTLAPLTGLPTRTGLVSFADFPSLRNAIPAQRRILTRAIATYFSRGTGYAGFTLLKIGFLSVTARASSRRNTLALRITHLPRRTVCITFTLFSLCTIHDAISTANERETVTG